MKSGAEKRKAGRPTGAEGVRGASNLERILETILRQLGKPVPVKEFRFHPTRKWRFDFAYPEQKIAIECEGGVFTGGRHTRGTGFENDCEKYNAAAAMGWRVFRVTANMLRNDPVGFVETVWRRK